MSTSTTTRGGTGTATSRWAARRYVVFDELGRIITAGDTRAECVGHLRRILARR